MNNLDKNVTGKETFYFIQYEDVVRDYSLMDKTGFDLFSKYEGCIIENGLFKFHTKGSSYIWTKYTSAFFKDYLNKIFCFGFDWMGRQFAVDLKIEMIYIFDSATGGAYQLDESLKDFLEKDLTIYREETFNIDFFDELYKIYKTEWVFSKCFGFSIPLFLNGKDEINNYECIDMEVYWDTNYQLLNKINNLPGGTLIDSVNVDQGGGGRCIKLVDGDLKVLKTLKMNKFYPLLVCRAGKSVSDTNNQQYGQAKLMTTNNEQAANATAFTDE